MGFTEKDLERLAAQGKIRGYTGLPCPYPKPSKKQVTGSLKGNIGLPSGTENLKSSNSMILDIPPFPKPRMTIGDKRNHRPVTQRYWKWVESIKVLARAAGYEPTVPLSIIFHVPMPPSWSKKKKKEHEGQPHMQRPDLDNYIKAFKDALLEEDSHIWQYGKMEKRWAKEGRIEIIIK